MNQSDMKDAGRDFRCWEWWRAKDVGTVFLLPARDGRAAIGQIVAAFDESARYLAVFDEIVDPSVEVPLVDWERAISGPVLLLGLSFTNKIKSGSWPVIGEGPVSDRISMPVYKEAVGRGDLVYAVDYSGRHRRRATPSEAARLPYREIVASVRFENALRAKLGLDEWVAEYDRLVPGGSPTTAEFFAEY